jgi:hypothetical protein
VLRVTGGGQVAIGAVPTAHAKLTVTLELFQPAAFGPGAELDTIVGGFVPMFSVTLAVAEFPATSVAVPGTVWPAPSVLIVCDGGQVAIGAVVFVHTKLTVTLELFQPLASGDGDVVAVILGGVKAIFNMTLAVAEFPARSVTVPVTA